MDFTTQTTNAPHTTNINLSPTPPAPPKKNKALSVFGNIAMTIIGAVATIVAAMIISGRPLPEVISLLRQPKAAISELSLQGDRTTQASTAASGKPLLNGYYEKTIDDGIYVGIYKGMWKDGKPHGQGEFVWSETVDVEWLASEITQDSFYDGNWADGEMEGSGILYYPKKIIRYNGDWKNGMWDGFGRHYSTPDNRWYAECVWKEGKSIVPVIGYNGEGDMWYLRTANGKWEINLSEGKIKPSKES